MYECDDGNVCQLLYVCTLECEADMFLMMVAGLVVFSIRGSCNFNVAKGT